MNVEKMFFDDMPGRAYLSYRIVGEKKDALRESRILRETGRFNSRVLFDQEKGLWKVCVNEKK